MPTNGAKPRRLRTIGDVRNWLAAAEALITDSRRAIDVFGKHSDDAEGVNIDPLQTARYFTGLYRRRNELFEELGAGDVFADPAWHMLIDLFLETKANRQVSVSSLCLGSLAPPTTALRYIMLMVEKGVLTRVPDPSDNRRIFISLAPASLQALEELFQ
jgi:DNA-binding MarR family transcriptional regulator